MFFLKNIPFVRSSVCPFVRSSVLSSVRLFGRSSGRFCRFDRFAVLPFSVSVSTLSFRHPPLSNFDTPTPLSNKYKSCRSLRFFEIRDFLNLIALWGLNTKFQEFKG